MRKRKTETRWSRRRRGYYYLVTAVGLFGFFLIVAGISSPDWTIVFAVLGFASLILCMSKGLALWNLDRLVFDKNAFGPTTRRQPDTAGVRLRDGIVRVPARGSRQFSLAEAGPSGRSD
jgi:hypothetical protein